MPSTDRRWFDSKPLVVLLLVFFFPAGLYALWKNREFSVRTKWAVSGVFVALLLARGLLVDRPNRSARATDEAAPSELVIKGVRFDELRVGQRDQDRTAPITATVTNTTNADIPGMQVGFVASDERGEMGPFWIPHLLGEESRWALKAGETKVLTDAIVGFGNRDLRNAKPVDIRILGESVKEVADRPEAERREIFLEIVGCESDANEAALDQYPENSNLPRSQQVELMKQRNAMSDNLAAACRDRVVAARSLTEEERRLISNEGQMKSWPPFGNN